MTAVAGTVFIAVGAFWLSFTSLADLAARSGIGETQAWAWPLIVDGVIVVSTVAVVALAGQRAAWYPWTLLAGAAAASVTANSIHAVVAADADVPSFLAACVAAVPPVVLLAITHLTVVLMRTPANADRMTTPSALRNSSLSAAEHQADVSDGSRLDLPETGEAALTRQERATALRGEGWSNKRIARELDVHPSTVGRWFAHEHLVGTEHVHHPRYAQEEDDD